MRKKLSLVSVALFLFFLMPLSGSQGYSLDFLATAISVSNNDSAVDGTDFTSEKIPIGSKPDRGMLIVTFTPAVPAAVSIDFELAISYDDGTTWTTGTGADAYIRVQVNTNVTGISSVVVMGYQVQFYGATHVKLYRVVVNSGAGNCTAINATLAMAYR